MNRALVTALVVTVGPLALVAQVKTNVPEVVPGARPATVERIKIHGQALEGNLEGDSVDRDAIYPGTHTSDVAVRFQEHVLPFFSRTLSFDPGK